MVSVGDPLLCKEMNISGISKYLAFVNLFIGTCLGSIDVNYLIKRESIVDVMSLYFKATSHTFERRDFPSGPSILRTTMYNPPFS